MSEPRQIAAVYHFVSETRPSNPPYETLLYSDKTLTCNCPGWRYKVRTLANGERTCKHTRLVQASLMPGSRRLIAVIEYECFASLITPELRAPMQPARPHAPAELEETTRRRVFNL